MKKQKSRKVASGATPQNTHEAKEKPKCVLLDEYDNMNTGEKDILTSLNAPRLKQRLIDWARKNPDAIKIGQFLEEEGINVKTWQRWREKYPILEEAHDHALTILGNRREHGIITKKFDAVHTARNMWIYDHDWARSDDRRAKLNEKTTTEGTVRYIMVPEVSDSPLVPKRKVDDE